ncbi:MAG TPA: PQQ-binding-like beta-propeller repeat protein [Polyangiaceae bacterium]|nr:PQQ-binding-like beta-propeller repeat protein [Polyangiaceae bacterium]
MRRPPRTARKTGRQLGVRGAACSVALLLTTTAARAGDPKIAIRLESAPARSAVVAARVDANGTNQTSALLPEHPSTVWQTRITPPLAGELAADAEGRLLVAHAEGRLTALDSVGHALWSVRVGAELALGPLPVAGGRSLLVTRDAHLIRVSAGGVLEGRETLPWAPFEQSPLAVPTLDGGAIVAAGSTLARIGPRGAEGYEARLPDPIRAVFEWQGTTLAVGHSGTIFVRRAAGDPVRFGSFQTPVRAVALVGQRLFALGRSELLTFDLVTKERRIAFGDPSAELRDFAALAGGRLRLVATGALLLDLDPNGHELGRVRLPIAESGGELASIVTDRTGRTLLGTTSSTLLTLAPHGDSAALPDSSCIDPMRPTPVRDGLFVVACRSGLLRGFSDRAR